MLSGAWRSSERKECFFWVISNLSSHHGVVTQALLPGNCGLEWTGSGQMRWKAIWLDLMTFCCFLAPTPIFTAVFSISRSQHVLFFTCSPLFFCSQCLDSFCLKHSHSLRDLSAWTHCSSMSSCSLSNQRNRKLPWNKNKQTRQCVIQWFGPFSSSAECPVSPSTFCVSSNQNLWLKPALDHLVERVLVLYRSGPASPVSIVVVLRCTTRGLQQAFRAVAPAL